MIRNVGIFSILASMFLLGCTDREAGTGTDTENVLFPSLAQTAAIIKPQSVDLKPADHPNSADFCYTEAGEMNCLQSSEEVTEHSYVGNVVEGTVLNADELPVANAKVRMNSCDQMSSEMKQFEVSTNEEGYFSLGVEGLDCMALEVSMDHNGETLQGFLDSVGLEETKAEVTYPMSVKGKIQLADYPDDQLFLIGIRDTRFNLVVQHGQDFKLVNVPRGVKYFYFLPVESEAHAKNPEGIHPVLIPLDGQSHDETRTINIEFLP